MAEIYRLSDRLRPDTAQDTRPSPGTSLEHAARLIEDRAFDMAGQYSTTLVSELILISARLTAIQAKLKERQDD